MAATWSAVVISQGDRPQELERSLGSLLAQQGVTLELIVVGNGWEPTGLPPQAISVHVPQNVGAPGGRNRGIERASGDLLFFLDDDAYLDGVDTLAALESAFAAQPRVGIIQTRIASPDGATARRWVPRLRDKRPDVGSEVFSVLEGSVAVRAEVLAASDGWAEEFFYAHEGIDLAWRAWDAGYTVEYRPEHRAIHPLVTRDRHADAWVQDGRNRVWLAKRNLPVLVGVAYVVVWGSLTAIANVKAPRNFCGWLRGAKAGLGANGGQRRAMSWRTVWRMTRHGRPPIV